LRRYNFVGGICINAHKSLRKHGNRFLSRSASAVSFS
jgi:hypothetical protein